jgi:lysozyme
MRNTPIEQTLQALACLTSRSSEFFALINTGHYDRLPQKFMEYTAAHGQHPLGLVRRRRAEGRLFATGDYDATH